MKTYSLFFAFVLFSLLNLNNLFAQTFSIQDLTIRNSNPITDTDIRFQIDTKLACSNYTLNQTPDLTLHGNMIIIDVHATSAGACLTNPVQNTLNTSTQLADAGTYHVYANSYLDGVLVNTVVEQLIVGPNYHPQAGNISSNSPVCEGQDLTVHVDATNTSTYQWQYFSDMGWMNLSDDAVYQGTATNTLHVLEATLSHDNSAYRCIVSRAGVAFDTSAAMLVTVNATPVVTVESDNDVFCEGSSLTLSSNSNDEIISYQWYKDNNPAVNGNTPNYEATQGGIYTLLATDMNGCMAQDSKELSTELCANTTVADVAALEAFPNPASNNVNIKASDLAGAQVILMNQQGQVLKQITAVDSNVRIDLEDLVAGMYLVQVINNDKVNTIKVVKQ